MKIVDFPGFTGGQGQAGSEQDYEDALTLDQVQKLVDRIALDDLPTKLVEMCLDAVRQSNPHLRRSMFLMVAAAAIRLAEILPLDP